MSTREEMVLDGKVDAYEEWLERNAPDTCECGGAWKCIYYDRDYGADADGRRGVEWREWECQGCGITVEGYV